VLFGISGMGLCGYFAPAHCIVGHNPDAVAILILNLFLGLTLVGFALICARERAS
jgi:hypothetical protein